MQGVNCPDQGTAKAHLLPHWVAPRPHLPLCAAPMCQVGLAPASFSPDFLAFSLLLIFFSCSSYFPNFRGGVASQIAAVASFYPPAQRGSVSILPAHEGTPTIDPLVASSVCVWPLVMRIASRKRNAASNHHHLPFVPFAPSLASCFFCFLHLLLQPPASFFRLVFLNCVFSFLW